MAFASLVNKISSYNSWLIYLNFSTGATTILTLIGFSYIGGDIELAVILKVPNSNPVLTTGMILICIAWLWVFDVDL